MAIEKIVNVSVKEIGADELDKKVTKLNGSLSDLDSKNKDVSKSMGDSQQSVLDNGGAMGLLNDATGGVAMTIKDAVEATALFAKESKIGMAVTKAYAFVVGTSTGAMKAFKIALIGTGIGLAVVALTLLITNFGKVKSAVMSLIPGLKAVGDFFGKIINAVTDFVGVTSEMGRAIDKLGEDAAKTLQKNKDMLANYGDELSEIEKKRIQIADDTANRIIEIQEREELSNEQKNAQIKLAQQRQARELNQILVDQEADAKKIRDEAEAKAKDEAKARWEKRKSEQEAINNEAISLEESQIKAIEDLKADTEQKKIDLAKERDLEEIEALRKKGVDVAEMLVLNQEKYDLIQADYEAKKAEEKAVKDEEERLKREEDRKTKQEQDQADAEKEIEIQQFVADAKKSIQDSVLNNISAGINLLSQLAGKSKALQATAIIAESAVGIAKTVISTQAANAAATLKYAAIPGGIALAAAEITANQISAGIGIAANVLATTKALSALGTGGGSAPAASGVKGGRSASAPPQFNIVGQNPNNQIAQTINNRQPLEAYVVSGNVTSAQAMERRRVRTATFGG